jgi:carboxylate-amine ligase
LFNRFHAARYGLNAIIIDPINKKRSSLVDDILITCEKIKRHAVRFGNEDAIDSIAMSAKNKMNDATILRDYYSKVKSLPEVVRMQTEKWMV